MAQTLADAACTHPSSCEEIGGAGEPVSPQWDGSDHDRLEPIAVIGFSVKFPQEATTAEGFWNLLVQGRSAMTEIPGDRFNINAFYHPDANRHDTIDCRGGHFLKDNIAAFDAPFFSMPSLEVSAMDPQQRSLLETCYHALENAGIPMEHVLGSRTSVHVGSFSQEYGAIISRDPELEAKYRATGTGTAMLANRLSWFFDLHGPSISLDTACSSSLNALHLSCQSLRSGESTTGLVCGANFILNPDTSMIPLSNLSLLSPDSKCYSFDHRANGYARGEGTAVIVLKLLSQAIQDGDLIRAVVRATGSNQDGRTPGITQPSQQAQEDLIRETYTAGGLDLRETRFFEAHGTGTPVGDPREASAISAVFHDKRSREEPLIIGAVKPNIGHLEGAAGLAGLVKTILILEKGVIPPNIWFERPNSSIPVDKWNIKFPVEITPWPTVGLRRASVNSFGYGGSNAHAVLDDAYNYMKSREITGKHCTVRSPPRLEDLPTASPPAVDSSPKPRTRLFVWSASEEAGLKRLATSYHEHLQTLADHSDTYLDKLSYTLSTKRSNLLWKSFLLAESVSDLQQNLLSRLSTPVRSFSRDLNLGFVFTGQGAQWFDMGRELIIYPIFRNSLQSAEAYLKTLGCEWSLTEEFFRSKESSNVNEPAYAQPLCTALQIALLELFSDWSISPTRVIGHSSGEIAAAYSAGGLSRESAWKIAYFRGALVSRLSKENTRSGSMIAIALSESSILPYLDVIASKFGPARLAVGCVNSPSNVTITGDDECVDALKVLMDCEQVFARKLKVKVAYHSMHMNGISSEYKNSIQDIVPPRCESAQQTVPVFFSSVTGFETPTSRLSQPEYWVENMVSKVNFSDALCQMFSYPFQRKPNVENSISTALPTHLVEIGPHPALRRSIKETLDKIPGSEKIEYHAALAHDVSALQSALALAGQLHCRGRTVNITAINNPELQRSRLQILPDLPEYPFNHSQLYWLESRLSKNFRFRKHGRHELLGLPTTDWNPSEGRWRNIIRVSENPWIKDHKFNGTEIYPAAGMIVMAIEAARQVSKQALAIKGYRLENVVFYKALLVSLAPEGVETEFYFRRRKDGSNTSDCNEFRLYTYSNEEWIEICSGTIITEYVSSKNRQHDVCHHQHKDVSAFGINSQKRAIESIELYENLEALGYGFGPAFQTLKEVSFTTDGSALATIDPQDWISKVPSSAVQDHVIHPTALDGFFHLTSVAQSKGGFEAIPTSVPTRLQSMWISNSLLALKNHKLEVHAKNTFQGYREAEYSIKAFDAINNECQISCQAYRGVTISNLETSSLGHFEHTRLCFGIFWKPDWATMTEESICAYCEAAVNLSDIIPPQRIDGLELACQYFISTVLTTTSVENFESPIAHVNRYLEWARKHYDEYNSKTILSNDNGSRYLFHDEAYMERFLESIEEGSDPEGKLYLTVGRNLMQILRGDIDILEFLFKGSLARDFYSSGAFTSQFKKIATYIDLLAQKNPSLRILEIGAGTGSTTAPILEKLGGQKGIDTPRYGQYVYTDISPSFFGDAKQRFNNNADRMVYQVLDIEKDPIAQGFERGKYDIVVASSVLHATSDINTALSNAHKLLKPGGKLILFEPCNLSCWRIPFVFGLLRGWWLGTPEQSRYLSPLLSEQDWHHHLEQNNFAGAQIRLRDYQDHRHTFTTFISTAIETAVPLVVMPTTFLITADYSDVQHEIASKLAVELRGLGVSISEITSVRDIQSYNLNQVFCISLLEMDNSFLYNIEEEDFLAIKAVYQCASGMLWLTRGGGESATIPEVGLITGFARSLRSENHQFRFVELALEEETSAIAAVKHILSVYQQNFMAVQEDLESEYMEKDGVLHINRVAEARQINDSIRSKLATQNVEMKKLKQSPERALTLTIGSPGLLDTLQFVDDTSIERPLEPDEVEIEVKAAGVNFKDILIAMGQLPGKVLGLECSGIITRLGQDVSTAELQAGDRVCCLANGSFKTRVRAYAAAVAKIPENLEFHSAAGLPIIFCTAYYALIELAHLKRGESVLIHSGAGGVGQAAIQLAMMLDAKIYVTVSSEKKKTLLIDLYNIPEDRFLSSTAEIFAEEAKKVTNGFDVILNSRSGKELRASWACIAPFGRFIEIGKKDIEDYESLSMSPFSKNVLFASVDLGVVQTSKPLTRRLMNSVFGLMAAKKIHVPQPLNVYRSSELQEAFRYLQSGKNTGKTVVEMHGEDLVPILPSTHPTYYFDQNATYVITGGFGGIGRSITRWMVDRKARHMLLLSRSGAKTEAALELLDEMKMKGVNIVAPACDISDEQALLSVLKTCSRDMPPIKGCIQGSMVLQDGLFESMSLQNFNAAVKPKAQGSWNLHLHLPRGMDFFILLSSTGGVIGARGQSNYAAGNTYQDTLARHRVSRGEKCFSLNLGLILSVGFVAERRELMLSLKTLGYRGIREVELHAMLEYVCDPSLGLPSALDAQIVTDLIMPQSLKTRKNIEMPYWVRNPLFRDLLQMGLDESEQGNDSADQNHQLIDYKTLLKATGSDQAQAGSIISQGLAKMLSRWLSIPEENIDKQKPVHSFGVDSLVAVEIRYWLIKEMKADVSIFTIMSDDSLDVLSYMAAGTSAYFTKE